MYLTDEVKKPDGDINGSDLIGYKTSTIELSPTISDSTEAKKSDVQAYDNVVMSEEIDKAQMY